MLKLLRSQCGPNGTTGYIDLAGLGASGRDIRIYTLERPWISSPPVNLHDGMRAGEWVAPPCGTKGVSCIPPGVYRLERHTTDAHPATFALVNPDLWVYHFESDVPTDRRGFARTAVLIHPANYVEELRGCIAPGLRKDSLASVVHDSRAAFATLYPFLKLAGQLEIIQL